MFLLIDYPKIFNPYLPNFFESFTTQDNSLNKKILILL